MEYNCVAINKKKYIITFFLNGVGPLTSIRYATFSESAQYIVHETRSNAMNRCVIFKKIIFEIMK